MIFEQIATGGCQSYLVGCPETLSAALIDCEASQVDRYMALVRRHGLHLRYVVDTHTHADHFSGARAMARLTGALVVTHRDNPSAYPDLRLDDGDCLAVGGLRLQAIHTPGHTRDSMSLLAADRVFTGDTLLIGGTGRSDLPTGDPEMLYESLFEKLLRLPPETLVFPAHDYKQQGHSSIGREIAENPRLQKRDREAFVAMMRDLNLAAPTHLTEALRTNISGGRTVAQLLAEAAEKVPFMALAELGGRLAERPNDLVVLDVREREAFLTGHIAGARHLARGQLELRVNEEFPDPSVRIVVYCEFGKISTLAAATLRDLGFSRAVALDGGLKAWRERGLALEA